ncbi:hypothetical protein LZ626_01505 [Aeromonas allosaccharophila]|uniref:hypothetical protein n=1 Tax=Aeromonas allosaccharophila TaxID=656 RepID=UPI001F3FF58A|nr:hypothetical protein [Aeromonas allosaccharophila]MCE9846773.1 hypothetical protein [Aeromonas allosaccharophila]
MIKLFDTNQSKTVLAKFRQRIDSLVPSSDFDKQRNSLIRLVINAMDKNPDEWNMSCQINIKWIGDQFISRLADEAELNKENLDDICSMSFRFLFELYLSTKNDLAFDFERARRFVFNNVEFFESSAREQIEYAIRDMPITIFKEIANSDEIETLKNFDAVAVKAKQLKEAWDKDLSERESRVKLIENSLSRYENAYNFVGLYQGFDDLSKEKIRERDGILFWLKMLSLVIVSPIIAELIFIYVNIDSLSAIRDGLLVSIFPTISLVAISIYYFRVLLFNYKSVKSQLLQIDLRKTLCRFIQSYSSYASEIKSKDADVLERFERVIFSGIVTEDGNLPSTFDGIEQISKLINSVKA